MLITAMRESIQVRTYWVVSCFSLLLSISSPLWAQGEEDPSAADDHGNRHIAATGTDLFAIPFPGELYSPLIGKMGHRATDMVINGNGPLSLAITREFEETPQAYPYSLGTMSLNNPRLEITIGLTSSEYNSTASRSLACDTWNKSVFGGDIRFKHAGGMERLVRRTHLRDTLLDEFPDEALFISPTNWYMSCDESNSSKFQVNAPDGTRYTTDKFEWYLKRYTDGDYGATFTLYVKSVEKAGSQIDYQYENAPQSATSPQEQTQVLPPLATTAAIVDNDRQLHNQQRIKSISLIDGSSSARTVNFSYRSSGAAQCPDLLDRVGSSSAPNGEVFYEYTQRDITYWNSNKRVQCELSKVLMKDGSYWEFAYEPNYTMSHSGVLSSVGQSPYDTADEVLHSRTLYLPLKSVTSPTRAKVSYSYLSYQLYECRYKMRLESDTGPGSCQARRPAVDERTVKDADGSSFSPITHSIVYDDNNDPKLTDLARRTIRNSAREHDLYFHLVDRISDPKSTDSDDIAARTNSGKIKTHYVFPVGNTTPMSGVEFDYAEMRNFLDYSKIDTPQSNEKSWQWAYAATRDNLVKLTTHYDERLFQSEWRQFNVYNLPAFVNALNVHTGEKRTTYLEYDNNYASKSRWVIGLVDIQHVGKDTGQAGASLAQRLATQRTYDADGQMSMERVQGIQTDYTYDAFGALATISDGRGNVTVINDYENGVARRESLNAGPAATRAVYGTGLVYRTIDEGGVRVDYRYDDMGRVTRTWNANDLGSRVDTLAPVWHDPSHSRYRNKKEFDQGGWSRYTWYDALGRPIRAQEHNAQGVGGDVWHKSVYDALGRVVDESYPSASDLGSGSWPGVTRTYDAVDRVLSETYSGAPGQVSYCYGRDCNDNGFGTNNRVDFGYAVKDQEGYVTVTNFRALGRPRTDEISEIHQQVDHTNHWVSTWIDRNIHGFITEVAQGQSRSNAQVRTYQPFPRSNGEITMRPGTETHPEFGTRQVTGYDAAGNLTQVSNFSGNTLSYTYTERNQIDTISASDGSYSVDHDYLPNGFLQALSTPDTQWNYSYVSGRALLASESLTLEGQTHTLDYGYDARENLSSVTYPNGVVASYLYNGHGQALSLSVDSGEGAQAMAIGALYFPNGQLKSLYLNNGLSYSATQNARTLPEQIKVSRVGAIAPPLDIAYFYDDRQNVKRIANYFYPYNGGIANATYDGLNRLVSVNGSRWGAAGASYDYDLVGNITQASLDGYTLDYSYTNNRLTSVSSSNHAKARAYPTIGYDGNGNIVSTGNGDAMAYDEMNQLVGSSRQTVTEGVVSQANRYDGQGYRVKSSVTKGGKTHSTYTLYNRAGNRLYEWDAESGEQRSHLFFDGKSIATLGTNATSDADYDGVPDYFERLHGMDPYLAADANEDADGDGLTNLNEYRVGSLIMSADSNNNGLGDEVEYEVIDNGIYPPGLNLHYLVPVIHNSYY